jgi:predicted Zn-dependent peptidase
MHIWLCCIAIGAPSFSLCKYIQILPRNVQVLPAEVKDAQQKKLEELKQQSDVHFRIELERKMALRYRKVKFFERRKIERRIRRLEKQQRTSDDNPQRLADIAEQLTQLKEDLEYVRVLVLSLSAHTPAIIVCVKNP